MGKYRAPLLNNDVIHLVDRRKGLKLNIAESEIADAAKTSKNKAKAVLNYLLEKGYKPTQIADSFAIASGGATFYRNRINKYKKEGLSDKVSFALQDYRNETEKYDRIVSVGMFEHVGVKYFKTYLSKANDILKENGVFLLHTIGQRGKPTATSPWIRKYIFPGGYIPSLSEVMNATQKLNINVTDVEVLRLHYAHTLSKWYQNVIENKDKIINMFDQRFFRMWEFYLLASKYSFVNMGNVVFQIQIAKNINNLPLTRNYIYN